MNIKSQLSSARGSKGLDYECRAEGKASDTKTQSVSWISKYESVNPKK